MKVKMIVALLIVGLSAASQAELFLRSNGMVYDDVLNITWLQDASMGGSRTWAGSVAWTGGLDFSGYDDWRLPSADVNGNNIVTCQYVDEGQDTSEVACRDNELGYMYYHNLNGHLDSDGTGIDLTGDHGGFTNIQNYHWTSTNSPQPGRVWGTWFGFGGGGVTWHGTNSLYSGGAWAVRDGDSVPEPSWVNYIIGVFRAWVLQPAASQNATRRTKTAVGFGERG